MTPVISDWRLEQRKVINDLIIDVTAMRTAILAFTAKFDTDATAQNIAVTSSQLDEDYATAVDPPAIVSQNVTKS